MWFWIENIFMAILFDWIYGILSSINLLFLFVVIGIRQWNSIILLVWASVENDYVVSSLIISSIGYEIHLDLAINLWWKIQWKSAFSICHSGIRCILFGYEKSMKNKIYASRVFKIFTKLWWRLSWHLNLCASDPKDKRYRTFLPEIFWQIIKWMQTIIRLSFRGIFITIKLITAMHIQDEQNSFPCIHQT